jgi:hypothetical protein
MKKAMENLIKSIDLPSIRMAKVIIKRKRKRKRNTYTGRNQSLGT